jgi:hypothetical protein
MADAPESISGGTTLFDTGVEIHKSLFIGETENKGKGGNKGTDLVSGERIIQFYPQSFPEIP